MLKGKQTWIYDNQPVIISSSAVVGPFEAGSPLADDFDLINNDLRLGEETFEKAEKKLVDQACDIAISKAKLKKDDLNLFICGDLINQIMASSFAARELGIPYLGIFGACSTSVEGLSLAALSVSSGFAKYALAATSSHNGASEKQFRYPTEYGAQKPPTAQWTVTGAGAAVVASEGQGPRIVCSTIGRVIDMGISDPFNMGAAMAPAAVDTIKMHFQDMGVDPSHYDLISTGDLGMVGHNIACELLNKEGISIPTEKFTDCGVLIYAPEQKAFAGGSGCACTATVTYGHYLNRMKKGELKRILVIATGALLSPMSYQQMESIPCIAHAVSIEM